MTLKHYLYIGLAVTLLIMPPAFAQLTSNQPSVLATVFNDINNLYDRIEAIEGWAVSHDAFNDEINDLHQMVEDLQAQLKELQAPKLIGREGGPQ